MSDLPYDFLSPHPPRRAPFAAFRHLQPAGLLQLKKDRIDPQRIRPAPGDQINHSKPIRTRPDSTPDLLDIQGFIIHKERKKVGLLLRRICNPPKNLLVPSDL